MDGEPLDTLDTLQVNEAAQRDTRRSSREAEHLGAFFAVERLERPPEPNDHRVGTSVAVVLCCSSPLVNIDIRSTGDEELQFFLVELGTKV